MTASTKNNSTSQRIDAATAFARQHDSNPRHALQVTQNALALFDALHALHGLGRWEREILEAAALLHDIGYQVRPNQHHKGSRDLILESGLSGFSQEELMVIACVARYHRGADPRPDHKVFRGLDADRRAVVCRLAAILRIGDGLDRSHANSLRSLHAEQMDNVIRIRVIQQRPTPLDIAAGSEKKALFEEIFGLSVEILAE